MPRNHSWASRAFCGLINTFDIAEEWSVDSNQDPVPDYDPTRRIDHIFVDPASSFVCEQWTVDLHRYGPDNRYPSDHFAMTARLRL